MVDRTEFSIAVAPEATVADVKSAIHRQEGIPSSNQGLVLAGRCLEDATRLQDYGIWGRAMLD
jgi:hypothetical protein